MSIFEMLRDRFANWLLDGMDTAIVRRREFVAERRSYRVGAQRRQLQVKPNRFDDNIVLNFAGLVVSRSVSYMFGGGVKFILPGGEESPESEWLDAVWDANKQQILLHNLGTYGAEGGTCFIKLVPEGTIGKDGKTYPRMIALDPGLVTVDTIPEDKEFPIRYTIRFNTIGLDGKELARKQVIELDEADRWTITDYQASDGTGGRWQQMYPPELWGYEFPPVLHWQNLPMPGEVYGSPDITQDVIELQDRINYIASNQSKIIRMAAHPIMKGIGIRKGDAEFIDTAPGNLLPIPVGGDLGYIEPSSDITKSLEFVRFLRQALFDISQQVDLDSLTDKLGALTNFGLRVLFADCLARINTKRELFGDALIEINHRLLVMGGFAASDGGKVEWGEFLPENEVEEITAIKTDLELGLVSKETAARMRGYDLKEEQEKMTGEADDVGTQILRAFNRGSAVNA